MTPPTSSILYAAKKCGPRHSQPHYRRALLRRILQFLFLFYFLLASLAQAQEETPVPNEPEGGAGSSAVKTDISKPEALPGAGESSGQAPSAEQKPSQGEGEKAPLQNRPTAVPEFSLPEVVITGENELTIGAKRLDRRENDVTLGSRDLTGLDRAVNDLPGLNKTFTALTAEEAGPSRDSTLVLHLGGGNPGTYGGWGLFGQQYRDFQYLLNGFYSTWGGEAAGSGRDGDKKFRVGLDTSLFPASPLSLGLSGALLQNDAELPYEGSQRELHQGLDLNGAALWKISNLIQARVKVAYQPTTLTYWDQALKKNQAQELEGQFKFSAEDLDPLLNRVVIEAGSRHATSDFVSPAAGAYDWHWVGLQTTFKQGESLLLTAKLQGQGGSGLDLPLKFFPVLDFTWRFFGKSQFNLYFRTDRYVDSFHGTYRDTEHVSPLSGFPLPTEISGEYGGRFTQKLSEKIIVSLSASTAEIRGYHQWTDITPAVPSLIQGYSTLGKVQLTRAGVNVQWNFMNDWQAAATYQWTKGDNASGGGRLLTGLPAHQGVLSLYRGDDQWETRLELQALSDRNGFENGARNLPATFTVGLDATYHLTKTLSFWLNGDNLLGRDFEIQPGYPAPKFHVRGGVEVIF